MEQHPRTLSLLTLPYEIRMMIWERAIGNQCIHLEKNDWKGVPWEEFQHLDSRTPGDLKDSYTKHVSGQSEKKLASDYRARYLQTFPNCHDFSSHDHDCFDDLDCSFKTTVSSLVQVCRSVHDEATRVLYGTNSFVFFSMHKFNEFILHRRQANQQHLLSGIDLYMSFWHYAKRISFFRHLHAMESVFSERNMKRFEGLKSLRVLLHKDVTATDDHKEWEVYKKETAVEDFDGMQICPLKTVSIVAGRNGLHRPTTNIPLQQRTALAATIQSIIKGGEQMKTEAMVID